jgi:hypothetical protein
MPGATRKGNAWGAWAVLVMPRLVSGIHAFVDFQKAKTWVARTSPAMTSKKN